MSVLEKAKKKRKYHEERRRQNNEIESGYQISTNKNKGIEISKFRWDSSYVQTANENAKNRTELGIDIGTRIKDYINTSDDLFNQTNDYYNNGYASKDNSDYIRKLHSDLRAEAKEIYNQIEQNKDSFISAYGENHYNSVVSQLKKDISNIKKRNKGIGSYSKVLNSFETEEDYNTFVDNEKMKEYYGTNLSYEKVQEELNKLVNDKASMLHDLDWTKKKKWLESYAEDYGYKDDDYYNKQVAYIESEIKKLEAEGKVLKTEWQTTDAGFNVPVKTSEYKRQKEIDELKAKKQRYEVSRNNFVQYNDKTSKYTSVQNNDDFVKLTKTSNSDKEISNLSSGLKEFYQDETTKQNEADINDAGFRKFLKETYEFDDEYINNLGDDDKQTYWFDYKDGKFADSTEFSTLDDIELLNASEKQLVLYYLKKANNTNNATEKRAFIQSAIDYVDAVKDTNDMGERQLQADYEKYKNASLGEQILHSALSVPANIVGGISSLVGDVVNKVQGEELDPYDDWHSLSNYSTSVRGGVSADISESVGGAGGEVLSWLYSTGLGIVDFAVELVASKGLGKLAGTTAKGTSRIMQGIVSSNAYSNTVIDAKKRGLDDAQALTLGISSGAIEWLTEKYSIEELMSIKAGDAIWKSIRNNALTEMSEEGASSLANFAVDLAVAGQQSNLQINIQKYIDEGYSQEEATKKAWKEAGLEFVSESMAGAVSGGVLGAGTNIAQNKFNSDFKKSDNALEFGQSALINNKQQVILDKAKELGLDTKKAEVALNNLNDVASITEHSPNETNQKAYDEALESASRELAQLQLYIEQNGENVDFDNTNRMLDDDIAQQIDAELIDMQQGQMNKSMLGKEIDNELYNDETAQIVENELSQQGTNNTEIAINNAVANEQRKAIADEVRKLTTIRDSEGNIVRNGDIAVGILPSEYSNEMKAVSEFYLKQGITAYFYSSDGNGKNVINGFKHRNGKEVYINEKSVEKYVFKHEFVHFQENKQNYKKFTESVDNAIANSAAFKRWVQNKAMQLEGYDATLTLEGKIGLIKNHYKSQRGGVGTNTDDDFEFYADFVMDNLYNGKDIKSTVAELERAFEDKSVWQKFCDFMRRLLKNIKNLGLYDGAKITKLENEFSKVVRTEKTVENDNKVVFNSKTSMSVSVDRDDGKWYNVSKANKEGELVNQFYNVLSKSEWKSYYSQIASLGYLEKVNIGDKITVVVGNKIILSERIPTGKDAHDFQVYNIYCVSEENQFVLDEIRDTIIKEGVYDGQGIRKSINRIIRDYGVTEVFEQYSWNDRSTVDNDAKNKSSKGDRNVFRNNQNKTNRTRISDKNQQNRQGIKAEVDTPAFSISEKTDTDYLKAVREGDLKTAQKMVDEVAEEKLKDSKVRDADGNLLVCYHGTDTDFSIFDANFISQDNKLGLGFYFMAGKKLQYSYKHSLKTYLNITDPITDTSKNFSKESLTKFCNKLGIEFEYDDAEYDLGIYERLSYSYTGKPQEFLNNVISVLGVDGVLSEDRNVAVAFSPNQIKSAEPVVYDDDGDIIPLSKRFDEGQDDIRFSISDEKFDFESFSNINKENLNNIKSRNGIVVESEAELENVIEKSLSEKKLKENYYLSSLPDDVISKIKSDINKDIFKNGQYTFSLSSDDIKHISKHFKTVKEIKQAIYRLYDVVCNYDTVEWFEENGENRLRFKKTYSDYDFLSIEIASKKRRAFDLVTFYLTKNNKKSRRQNNSPANTQNNGELASKGVSSSANISITNYDENVNPKLSISDDFDGLVDKYGSIPEGMNAERDIAVPKRTSENQFTSYVARSIMEKGSVDDATLEQIKEQVVNEALSHKRWSDKEALDYAQKQLKDGEAEIIWNDVVSGKTLLDKNKIAVAEGLLEMYANEGKADKVLTLTAELCEVGTRAGQVVQAFSLLKNMGGVGRLYYLQKVTDSINRDIEKKFGKNKKRVKIEESLATRMMNAKSDGEVQKASEDIMKSLGEQVPPTFLDKWNAWRYLSMLGNPRTHIRNLVGNAIFMPAISIKNGLATAMEHTFIRDVNNRTKAIKVSKEVKEFAEKDFEQMKEFVSSGGKYQDGSQIQEYTRVFKSKILEGARKFNFDMLEKEDIIFLKQHYKMAFARFVTARKLDVNNLTEKQLWEAREYATLEAQKATYRDASAVAEAINRMSHNNLISNVLIEGILPFKKTPINILKRGVEYSPIGLIKTLLKGSFDLRNGKITASQYIDGISSGLAGTGIMALGVLLGSLGVAIGGMGDDEDKWFRQQNGEQEYSITLWGKSYTVDWAAPSCIPFFIGVELQKILSGENENWATAFVNALDGALEPLTNLSMLQGINDTLETIKWSDSPSTSIVIDSITSYFTQALPTLAGQITRVFDGTRRKNYVDKNSAVPEWLQKVANTVSSKTGNWGKNPYRNAWGETEVDESIVGRIVSNFISPGYYSSVDYDAVNTEIARLYNAKGNKLVLPETVDNKISVNGVYKYLNADEYEQFQMEAGQNAYKYIDEVINSAFYTNADDDTKVDMLADVYTYCENLAKTTVSDYTLSSTDLKIKLYLERGVSMADYLKAKYSEQAEESQEIKTDVNAVDELLDSIESNYSGATDKMSMVDMAVKFIRDKQRDDLNKTDAFIDTASKNGYDIGGMFVANEGYDSTDKKQDKLDAIRNSDAGDEEKYISMAFVYLDGRKVTYNGVYDYFSNLKPSDKLKYITAYESSIRSGINSDYPG